MMPLKAILTNSYNAMVHYGCFTIYMINLGEAWEMTEVTKQQELELELLGRHCWAHGFLLFKGICLAS